LFFDISRFSRLAASTGTQARSRRTAKPKPLMLETATDAQAETESCRGSVRVYSELLVEENVKSLKAKIEAPRC
jgi:hypothetical protein